MVCKSGQCCIDVPGLIQTTVWGPLEISVSTGLKLVSHLMWGKQIYGGILNWHVYVSAYLLPQGILRLFCSLRNIHNLVMC